LNKILKLSLIIFTIFLSLNCEKEQSYDSNVSVPKGDPPFPPLGNSWIIDKVGVLSEDIIIKGDAICQALKEENIAEMVVLIQIGIKHPEKYATHYGRWLKLGRKGKSIEGGNNGIVWLIRPDAKFKITISVGRGLPRFTSSDYGEIMEKAKEYLNFNNYDKGVMIIIEETAKKLRELYSKRRKE